MGLNCPGIKGLDRLSITVIFRWALTVPHPPISFGTRGISADLFRSVITDLECELEWLTSGASTRPVCPPVAPPVTS